jgi:hypothetical protein
MSGRAVGVAWLRREDYQRIREISDDEMVPTFDEFEAKMTRQLSNLEAAGMVCKKVIIDPDELLAYARRVHGGKINSKVRAGLAGFLVMKKTRPLGDQAQRKSQMNGPLPPNEAA